ncbi:MAG: [FeFe] hydrogenase H-cluster maturation GTPase HydF [Mangrovibacterium sp.]
MKSSKSFRLHIGLFGRRNVGKSSLLNVLTGQEVSIVSDVAGTTTDPVEKPMELLPFGPVLFIDTAGIDDSGALGQQRIGRTLVVIDRTDLAVLVSTAADWGPFEESLLQKLQKQEIPVIVVLNKSDLFPASGKLPGVLAGRKVPVVTSSAIRPGGTDSLREMILRQAPDSFINRPAILSDLVGPEELAVLVVPIDKEAPKGRLILPQVQSIRDLLDGNACCLVVRDNQLKKALNRLKSPPRLVVTDSQAFARVAECTPENIPLTGFSILMARYQGDLTEMVRGALCIDRLRAGDRVLIAEACTHHPIEDDIGTVKIPRWLNRYAGGVLQYTHMRGHDFPSDLRTYRLIIHCGACMWNRREMLSRILKARQAGVPLTNYGLSIAYSLGIFERALSPFPEVMQVFRGKNRHQSRGME